MSYFGGSLSPRGDPGFFGSLFSGVAKLGRAALGISSIPTVIRATRGAAAAVFPQPRAPQRAAPPPGFARPGGMISQIRTGPITAQMTRIDPRTGMPVRRRRMNVTNPKALRRAIRRTDGFVRIARSALKNTGFKIVSKSAGRMTEAQWQKRAHHAK